MSDFTPGPNKKPDSGLRQVSLLASVPALLLAGPLVGFFIGKWADQKFHTEPYLLIVGVILGFGAAGVEIYKLVKKSEEFDREDRDEK